MNMNLRGIKKKHEKFIKDSSLNDLKKYIDNLTKEYYNSISNPDEVLNIMEIFNSIVNIRTDIDIEDYIQYSLINAFNNSLVSFSDSSTGLDLINLNESKVNKYNAVANSGISEILVKNKFEKVTKITDDFFSGNPTAEDILNYLNYWKYKQ